MDTPHMLDGEDTNGAFSDGNTIQHSRRIPLSTVTKALRRHVTDPCSVVSRCTCRNPTDRRPVLTWGGYGRLGWSE